MNPYSVLNINKTASKDDIKAAYRNLAKLNHPDKGGNEDKFKEINEAYQILMDDSKRNLFDKTGSVNPQQQQHHGNPFSGFPEDIFSQFMNFGFSRNPRNSTRKREDLIQLININMDQAFFGCTKTLKITRPESCQCAIKCQTCNGNGIIKIVQQIGPVRTFSDITCNRCNGSGSNSEPNCTLCKGSGKNNTIKTIELSIPKSCPNDYHVVFEGLGHAGTNPNEIDGNLVFVIRINPDKRFSISGNDLIYNCTIPFIDSIIGSVIEIEHFSQKVTVDTKLHGIIYKGKEIILPGFGFTSHGSLKIKCDVEYPQKILSNEESKECQSILNKIFYN